MKARVQAGAFSLVEISLALGIISFALLALVGLLSQVLDRSRESSETFLFSNLASGYRADLEERTWTELPTNPETNYIDGDGNSVASSKAVFDTILTLLAAPPPGVESSVAGAGVDHLRFFRIEMRRSGAESPTHVTTLSIAHRQ